MARDALDQDPFRDSPLGSQQRSTSAVGDAHDAAASVPLRGALSRAARHRARTARRSCRRRTSRQAPWCGTSRGEGWPGCGRVG
eukprot:16013158-Heterocapsa_arctica.AAC.1